MSDLLFQLPEPIEPLPPEPVLLMQMLLVEKVHWTFDKWLIRLFRIGELLEDKPFTIRELRLEYLRMCWKEEMLWKKWKEANDVTKE